MDKHFRQLIGLAIAALVASSGLLALALDYHLSPTNPAPQPLSPTLFWQLWGTGSLLLAAVILLLCIAIFHLMRPLAEALESSRRQHEFTWEHVSGIAMRVTRQQRLMDANPNLLRLFNLLPGDLLSTIQTADERDRIRQYLEQAADSGSLVDFECNLVDRDGDVGRWAIRARPWSQDNNQYLLVTGDDISKRHYMEILLREEQQRLSTYLETMQTLLMVCDADGLVRRVNHQTLVLLQLSEKQVNGFPLSWLMPRHQAQDIELQIKNVIGHANGSLALEFPLVTTHGRERIVNWRITWLEDCQELLLAGLDITEIIANRTALEAANQRIREALTQAELANHSKSIFLANMSHEIRTPMNGILGATELILDSSLSHEQRHYLDIIHRSSQGLLEILNDILDLSKIESGHLELEDIDFDLNQLLTEVCQLFREPARRQHLNLIYYYSGHLPHQWRGDPKRLRQVITNLLSNALKFTEEGRIEIRVEGEQTAQREYRLDIAIIDTGIGISANQQEQIFSAFRQADSSTSRRYGGTGLGLTICRHLAEAMKGQILLQSEPGRGSTFTLTLPLRQATLPTQPGLAARLQPVRLQGHVLLAEDNEVNRKVATRMLEKLGLTCLNVNNGEEAMEAVQRTPVDLVLMDINMPVLDGIQATRAIRALKDECNSVPILALTANAMMEDRRRCLEAGMNGFISKPIRLEQLRQALLEALPTLAAP